MAVLFATPVISSASIIPQSGYSGRPGDGTCRDCHPAKHLVAADSSVIIGLPETWEAGVAYPCTLVIRHKGLNLWTFEMTTVDSLSVQAGALVVTDPVHTVVDTLDDIIYFKNTIKGAYLNQPDSACWAFTYNSPDSGAGPVSFYWCAYLENRNHSEKYYLLENCATIPEATGN
jgi:hypothetical protein